MPEDVELLLTYQENSKAHDRKPSAMDGG